MEPLETNAVRWGDLSTRILGIIPLLAITIVCVLTGGFLFIGLVLFAAMILIREWDKLTASGENASLHYIGYPLLIIPSASLIWLRSLKLGAEFGTPEDTGRHLVISLMCVIAATDIGAYFTGKRFGEHKIAPLISPGKTWEGLGGGVACAALVTALFYPDLPLLIKCITGAIFALLAQAGDLLESWIKRRAGVKNSGDFIPGHGGLLDRVDGYLITAPALALLVFFFMHT